MSNRLHIQNEYPADWAAIGDRVREEVGHRCIRCKHPYRTGTHGKGEWTPCDEQCTHAGPLGVLLSDGSVVPLPTEAAVYRCANIARVVAQWRILTVHHLDGDKANCEWWNLLPLWQRCHLQVQARVNPAIPWFLEHSDWFKPYVAGYYAKKYEGRNITREEATRRLAELLALERLA
jgi:hypothetical protein